MDLPLATVPNAGIPVGFRKRAPNGDEKCSGAGILFATPKGDGLFLKRKGADQAGTWSIPAGRVEQDEEPCDAARRESIEEIGVLPKWELAALHRETRDGVDFATFGQQVDDRFDPVLNDEHDEYVWAPLDDPPQPLHPGLAALLEKFAKPAVDGEIKSIKIKFKTGEGEDQTGGEALEALQIGVPQKGELEGINTDSKLKLALDRSSVRSFDEDGRMRVSVANISKANICPYRGDEIPGWDPETKKHALGLDPDKIYKMFRDPAELKKSVPTWNGVQLLRKHVPVDAKDHRKHDIVGTTGTNAEFADPYLRNSLVFWTNEGIDLVESNEQRELSSGYHYDPDMTPGTFNGEPFDGVMRNIRGNHVALVEEGRVGSDVAVGDSIEQLQWAAIEHAIMELAA